MAARMLSSATLNSLRQRFGDGPAPPACAPVVEVPPSTGPCRGDFGQIDLSNVPPLTEVRPIAEIAPHDVPLHPGLHKDYQPLHMIGVGGYAAVLRVRERGTGKICVIKKIQNAFASGPEDAQRVVREIGYQAHACHPNVLPLLGAFCSSLSPDIYLLFPAMSLDMHDAIRANRLTTPIQRQAVAYQLTCALGYMHAAGALHRDLKPPNVLLDMACRVVLCDFGLMRTVPSPSATACAPPAAAAAPSASVLAKTPSDAAGGGGLVSNSVGSRWYRAPELLLGANAYGTAVDMWSLGCVLAELLTGKTLLLGSSTASQLGKICSLVGGPPDEETLRDLQVLRSPTAAGLLRSLPTSAPAGGLGKLMPRAPPEGCDLCARLLHLKPSLRLSASAVIRHPFFRPFLSAGDTGAPSKPAAASPPPAAPSAAPSVSALAPAAATAGASELEPFPAASFGPLAQQRAAYGVRSCATALPYVPPLPDETRLTVLEYRTHLAAHLATALAEPDPAALVAAGGGGPVPGGEEMDDMMGA